MRKGPQPGGSGAVASSAAALPRRGFVDALLVTALVAVLARLLGDYAGNLRPVAQLISSDTLWIFDFTHDLRAGGALHDWRLPAAPLWVPELLGAAVLSALFDDPRTALLAWAFAQPLALAGLGGLLAARLWGRPAATAFLATWTFYVAMHAGFDVAVPVFITLVPAHHVGGALLALFGFTVLEAHLRAPRRVTLVLASATALLASASDLLVAPAFVAPAVLSVLVARNGRRRWLEALVLGGAGALGLLSTWVLTPSLIAPLPTDPLRGPLGLLRVSALVLGLEPGFVDASRWLGAIAVAVGALVSLRALRARRGAARVSRDDAGASVRDERTGANPSDANVSTDAGAGAPRNGNVSTATEERTGAPPSDANVSTGRDVERIANVRDVLTVALALGALLVFGVTVASTVAHGRYLATPLCTALLFVARLVSTPRFARVAVALAALAVVAACAQPGRGTTASDLLFYDTVESRCVDAIAARTPLHLGLADYWVARPVRLLSGSRPQLVQANLAGQPEVWGASRAPLRDVSRANFVITSRLDPEWLEARYGPPSRIETCGRVQVLLFEGAAQASFAARLAAEIETEKLLQR